MNSNSVSFGEKMKNENGSPISFFYCKEKRKTKIKFVSFSYTIENRLALRYTDCLALGFSYASSSLTINNCQAYLRSTSASFA